MKKLPIASSSVITTLVAVLALAMSVAAISSPLTPDDLLAGASTASKRSNWIRTAEYLFAYTQSNSPDLRDSDFRRQIEQALQTAEWNARSAGTPVAGTGGKSDDLRSGAGGNARPVNIPRPKANTRVKAKRGNVKTDAVLSRDHRKQVSVTKDHRTKPKSYRLVCRGGGGMYADYHALGRAPEIRIHFKRARSPVREQRPGYGECAWLDRPVSSREPAMLRMTGDHERSGIQVVRLEFAGKKSAFPAASIRKTRGSTFDELLTPIARAFLFQVECYNDGESLRIVRVLGKAPIPPE